MCRHACHVRADFYAFPLMLMAFGALVFINDFTKICVPGLGGCKHGVIDDLLTVSVGQTTPTGK